MTAIESDDIVEFPLELRSKIKEFAVSFFENSKNEIMGFHPGVDFSKKDANRDFATIVMASEILIKEFSNIDIDIHPSITLIALMINMMEKYIFRDEETMRSIDFERTMEAFKTNVEKRIEAARKRSMTTRLH